MKLLRTYHIEPEELELAWQGTLGAMCARSDIGGEATRYQLLRVSKLLLAQALSYQSCKQHRPSPWSARMQSISLAPSLTVIFSAVIGNSSANRALINNVHSAPLRPCAGTAYKMEGYSPQQCVVVYTLPHTGPPTVAPAKQHWSPQVVDEMIYSLFQRKLSF